MTDLIIKPFAWLLRTLYVLVNNYGAAVILFAVIVRLILMPFQMKSKRSSLRMSRLNPRLKELEKRHSGNQTKYQEEVSKLYKEENINPMSGCLWSLIPLPIMMALLQVIRYPITRLMGLTAEQLQTIIDRLGDMGLYTMAEKPGVYYEVNIANLVHKNFDAFSDISEKLLSLDFTFLGMDLGETPQWNFFMSADWSQPSQWLPQLGLFLIPILSAVFTYIQMHIASQNNPAPQAEAASTMKSMNLMMPVMSLFIGFTLPAALGIYWMVGYIWSIPQDLIANKHYNKILDAEEAERNERYRLRDLEFEKKRAETERLRQQGLTNINKSTSKKKIHSAEKARKKRAAENKKDTVKPDSQVGSRKYARGRAYVPDRFTDPSFDHTADEPDNEPDMLPASDAREDLDAGTASDFDDADDSDDNDDADDADFDDAESDSESENETESDSYDENEQVGER